MNIRITSYVPAAGLQENRFVQLVNNYFLGIVMKKEYNSYNG